MQLVSSHAYTTLTKFGLTVSAVIAVMARHLKHKVTQVGMEVLAHQDDRKRDVL